MPHMVKCHIQTFHWDLFVTHNNSQISAHQVSSMTHDQQIDWNHTVLAEGGAEDAILELIQTLVPVMFNIPKAQ